MKTILGLKLIRYPNAICYFNNIKLEKVENNNNQKAYFKEKDWDNFSDEQITFENDTVNVCVF